MKYRHRDGRLVEAVQWNIEGTHDEVARLVGRREGNPKMDFYISQYEVITVRPSDWLVKVEGPLPENHIGSQYTVRSDEDFQKYYTQVKDPEANL